jgi:segregation and condensation protein B
MHPELSHIIEAIVFASEQPAQAAAIFELLSGEAEAAVEEGEAGPPEGAADLPQLSLEQVTEALEALTRKYEAPAYPFEVRKVGGGYQFFTKADYHPYLRRALAHKNRKRLSRAALEVLSIIAYRQPVTKTEVEFIRGVNCDYAVQKLLERNLISITGRSDAPGRPLLYSTSPYFMQYLGLRDMSDLPRLKEFEELAEDHLEMFRQHQEETHDRDGQEAGEEAGRADEEALLDGGGKEASAPE